MNKQKMNKRKNDENSTSTVLWKFLQRVFWFCWICKKKLFCLKPTKNKDNKEFLKENSNKFTKVYKIASHSSTLDQIN